jgi:hypothetical protein
MSADTIKLIFTYGIALVLIVGGGVMLYSVRLDPAESGSATLSLAIVGFIGAAVQFIFSSESATRATRAAQASTSAGVDAAMATPPVVRGDGT